MAVFLTLCNSPGTLCGRAGEWHLLSFQSVPWWPPLAQNSENYRKFNANLPIHQWAEMRTTSGCLLWVLIPKDSATLATELWKRRTQLRTECLWQLFKSRLKMSVPFSSLSIHVPGILSTSICHAGASSVYNSLRHSGPVQCGAPGIVLPSHLCLRLVSLSGIAHAVLCLTLTNTVFLSLLPTYSCLAIVLF